MPSLLRPRANIGAVLSAAASALVVSFGCSRAPSVSATTEIAASPSGAVYLYWRDGADIARTRCEADRQVYDHHSCHANLTRVPAGKLYAGLRDLLGAELPLLEQRLGDLVTRLQRDNAKLLELLSAVPAAKEPELRARIAQGQLDAAAAAAIAQGLADQAGRIQALPGAGTDPDLQGRLAQLVSQEGVARAASEGKWRAVEALEERFIHENSSLFDQDVFTLVDADRNAAALALAETRDQLDGVTRRLATLARTLNMLEETGFVYAADQTINAVMDRVGRWLEAYDEQQRTVTAAAATGRIGLSLDVARDGVMDHFSCVFKVNDNPFCHTLRVTSPAGVAAEYAGTWDEYSVYAVNDAAAHPGLYANARGSWLFDIRWSCSGGPVVTNAPTCTVHLAPAP